MRRDVPWAELRAAYGAGASCADLARRWGLHPSTVYRRCRQEGWRCGAGDPAGTRGTETVPAAGPGEELTARLEALTADLLAAADRGEVSIREVKDLAALAKDLAALRRARGEDVPNLVRVELSKDLVPWTV